jgi:hypothetical protein
MTNETKQTAVDWQFNQLSSENLLGIFTHDQMTRVMEILEEAKEIEKEQIINSYEDCSTIDGEFLSGEQFYEQTYGGSK